MRPKPFSIRHRFVLLQVASFTTAVLLVASAIYCSEKLRLEIEKTLADLRVAVTLHAEIEVAEDDLMISAVLALLHPEEDSNKRFEAAAHQLDELGREYLELPLPDEERRAVQSLGQLHNHLVTVARNFPAATADPASRAEQLGKLGVVHHEGELALQEITRDHLRRLESSEKRQRTYSRLLSISLAGLGVVAIVVLRLFRRSHRRDIWQPHEELRRLMAEIRCGNLSPSTNVPDSVELGALVRGFLDMAGELRTMRNTLEEQVCERTAELESTQKELIQAAKLSSLGQLVSGVAHEINNPLTSILGFSELALERPGLDPTLRAHLQRMRDEAVRLRSLVANLRSFARPGLQRHVPLDLCQLLDRVADLRLYQLSANNIQLHVKSPAQPVWVNGDSDQLVQVFFNLVLNAEQAILSCRDRGDIWMACGLENGRVTAAVRDNGPGIAPDNLERIFDPFFTTRPAGKGSGLGLSISHGIIQQHGGTITADIIEGQGTLMRIALPAGQSPENPVPPAPAPAPALKHADAPADSAGHILVIDDETAITHLVQALLKSRGWTCAVLNDPLNLETALHGNQFDAVLCDLKMPGRNGVEILRLLQQLCPKLAESFLLMTGNVADAGEKQSRELAGVRILHKPFHTTRLIEALQAVLRKPS